MGVRGGRHKMHKRLVTLLVVVLAGVLTLATSGRTANAVTKSSGENAQASTNEIRTITVQKGDYLDRLAQDNGTTFLRLFYANEEIKDPDFIYPGQTLRIPGQSENLAPRPLPEQVVVPAQPAAPTVRSATPQVAAPAPRPAPAAVAPAGNGVWDQLAACESGGNWSINTGNGYYGGLQFALSSWQAVGGSGYPHQASKSEQIHRAQLLQARQGWGAWPACSAKLGLL